MTSSRTNKLFTVEEANSTLPLVKAITEDWVRLSREVVERRERLASLMQHRRSDNRDVYGEELSQIQEELEKDTERLQEFVQELRELGVEPKSGLEGLVDFPALHEGRLVYLCWRMGEPYVQFWHDLESGFSGRQPIEGCGDSSVLTGESGGLGA